MYIAYRFVGPLWPLLVQGLDAIESRSTSSNTIEASASAPKTQNWPFSCSCGWLWKSNLAESCMEYMVLVIK